MKTYNLKLVRSGLSVLWFVFMVIVFLITIIVIAIFSKDIPKTTFLFFLLSTMCTFIYALWKFYDKLLIKYKATLKISDNFFELNQSQYYWEDVEWYRTDTNSAIMNGFVVGVKGFSSLKFHVTNKNGDELEIWKKMKKEFLETLSSKNIKVRNYYNSVIWRRTARILLASIIIVPAVLTAMGIDFLKILPGFLVWVGTSVTLSVTIFSNQKK